VVWKSDVDDPRKQAPFALMVHFDRYSVPPLYEADGKVVISIFRSKREFFRANIACSRTQFPITIGYAITVHKSQGITVPCALLNISDRDFAPGLTYVAISRLKSLDGILFEEAFDFERFQARQRETMRMRQADVERRIPEHV
jgi:ATP-dependent DNA helicase PIF1